MKTFKIFLIVLAGACTFMACDDFDDFFGEHGNTQRGLDQERYVTMATGLRIHYRIVGKGPVDMVFIPGWTNPLTVYTMQFDYFRDKARAIYIDLPGHGLSSAPEGAEYTMELMAEAIYTVVKKEGVKKFTAVGFSWGHTPLTQFELWHPDMIVRLILLDITPQTWPPMTEEVRNNIFTTYLNMTPEVKQSALEGLIPAATAPADLLEWGKYFLDFPNPRLANMYYHYLAEEVCQPYEWSVPILIICNVLKPAKQAKFDLFFPGYEVDVLGGDQHIVQWAYHETVNPLIENFMPDRPGNKYQTVNSDHEADKEAYQQ